MGNIPTNSSKRGVNRQVQAKLAEYKNRDILQSINTINIQHAILGGCMDHQTQIASGPL